MILRATLLTLALTLTACSSWVYRIDIAQGNFLEQRNVDKLQLGMTKEQVKFVLGTPVVQDTFEHNVWHYVYRFKSGRSDQYDAKKNFIVKFKDNKLAEASGDFELPESFYTPIKNDK